MNDGRMGPKILYVVTTAFVLANLHNIVARASGSPLSAQASWPSSTVSFFNYAERITRLAIDVNKLLAGRKRFPEDFGNEDGVN